ncbi:rhamnose-binding lectin-like isoform X1 [Hoplias malabaricus]|uniref:rhamnose-binding lectin-like isoform X1 n=1 Tax=Hoplias malabaricus TaxID=27720 RepID=UPI0034630B52
MLFLKLSLLTLLMAVLGMLTYAENVITCYGSDQRLSCESGLIRVKSAIYGRTDSTVCSVGRPASETQNTQCSMNVSLISDMCNGRSVCEFRTDTLGLPDPCYGTYKYFNTTYDCVTGRSIVSCEGSYISLDCGDSVVNVLLAKYGRRDSTTCSAGRPVSEITKTDCYVKSSLATVKTICEGKNSCTLSATNDVFYDPCVGTYKYLSMTYTCVAKQTNVTCEGNTAVLTCDSGVLNILSANYGRTDSITCSAGRPSNEVTNTHCFANNTLSVVKNSCGGKSKCAVSATNNVFTDPCVGTYKYLTVVYSCIY